MTVSEATLSRTINGGSLTLSRITDHAVLTHFQENGEVTVIDFPWEVLCQIPGMVDEMRRLFGEPTALDR